MPRRHRRDSVEDGYEYQAAVDLNHYTERSRFPIRASGPTRPARPGGRHSGGTDYDDDGLTLREEFRAVAGLLGDGTDFASHQRRSTAAVQRRPAAIGRGPAPPTRSRAGPSTSTATSCSPTTSATPTPTGWATGTRSAADDRGLVGCAARRPEGAQESKYPELDFLDMEDTAPAYNAHIDPDMDGDGVLDGLDDNDHDGLSNQFEVRRPDDWIVAAIPTDEMPTPANPWAYTHPFNPCKPFNSDRCHLHPPFGYYATATRCLRSARTRRPVTRVATRRRRTADPQRSHPILLRTGRAPTPTEWVWALSRCAS